MFSTGSISCKISNKDYDLSHPSWTPPLQPTIYSPFIYAAADGDVKGEARVRWEGTIDYKVVGSKWLLPIWALWVVVVAAIKVWSSMTNNVSAAVKGASLITTPAAPGYAQVAVVEEPVFASIVPPSPSAPPK